MGRAWPPTAAPAASSRCSPTRVQDQTGALFVVITNAQGIRLTHPNPALIGTPVTYHDPEPTTTEPFRTGRTWIGIQRGTLGSVAAGKVPLWLNGRLVGEVSVGYHRSRTSAPRSRAALPSLSCTCSACSRSACSPRSPWRAG